MNSTTIRSAVTSASHRSNRRYPVVATTASRIVGATIRRGAAEGTLSVRTPSAPATMPAETTGPRSPAPIRTASSRGARASEGTLQCLLFDLGDGPDLRIDVLENERQSDRCDHRSQKDDYRKILGTGLPEHRLVRLGAFHGLQLHT